MRYIYATKGSFIAFIIFLLAVIFIPGKGSSHEVEIILTISTFLFAVLAGFFISRLNSRYDSIRELLADEDAYWLSFYKVAGLYGKDFSNKVKKLIDQYYIIIYDFDVGFCYKYNAKYFLAIYDELQKIKKYRSESAFQSMLEFLAKIESNRNKSSVLGLERIKKGQWSILIILVGIIIFSVFYLKTSELYSQIIVVLLSTILILVLLIVRDLQNLRLNGEPIVQESGQEIFEYIGELRYYNHIYIKDGSMKPPKYIKKYRMGLHRPGEKIKTKVVNR